jgi:hypothetical protein
MTCAFTGMINGAGDKDHLITTDDPVMVKTLGLSSFTLMDLYEALQTRVPYGQIIGGTSPEDVINILMGTSTIGHYLEKFNVGTGKYEKKYPVIPSGNPPGSPYGRVASLHWDNFVRQIILLNRSLWTGDFDNEGWDNYTKTTATALIDAIQASPDGHLTFNAQFQYNYSVEGAAGCVTNVYPIFKLYLYDKDYPTPSARRLATAGAPLISAPAVTSAGLPIGATILAGAHATTAQGIAEQRQHEAQGGAGTHPPRRGANTDNTAAELDMHYEPNTGKWESGTTNILARLLTDLPAVPVNPIEPGAIDSQSIEEYTNPASPTFLSPFEPGWAMPLSVHKGNPHLFAPTWVDKECKGDKKHKIKVTNRAGRSFAAGDLVMCFKIGGHWYVMDFGSDAGAAGVFKIGKWSFMNMISERRAFFRDNRYYQAFQPGATVPVDPKYMGTVSPSTYEAFFRENWFYDLKVRNSSINVGYASVNYPEIARWNVGDGTDAYFSSPAGLAGRDFQSCMGGYYQQTNFDLLYPGLGGTHDDGNMIGRTHIFNKPDGTQETSDFPSKSDFFPFWGATFPDGYATEKINDLKTGNLSALYIGGDPMVRPGFDPHLVTGNYLQGWQAAGIFNTGYDRQKWGIWTNAQDKNGLQCPADVALLAAPNGENGYGMESFIDLKDKCSVKPNLSYNGMFYNLADVNGLGYKFNWLTLHDGSSGPAGQAGSVSGVLPSLYDFKPLSPQRVDFKPLWADYLGSLDPNSNNHFAAEEKYYDIARGHFYPTVLTGFPAGEAVIGTAFCSRIATGGQSVDVVGPPPWRGVPYGEGVGGSTIQNYRGDQNSGNIVGMTLAKAKINVKATELSFTTTQWLGLANKMIVSGGGGSGPIGIGGGLGVLVFDPGAGVSTNRYPQWGRNSDAPWQGGSFGTTALHARLCDQWPDEDTLLEPRYFAVMHFNPQGGIYRTSAGGTFQRPLVAWENTGYSTLVLAMSAANNGAGWRYGEQLPEHQYQRGVVYTSVDLKVPTWYTGTGSQVRQVPIGTSINGDNHLGAGSLFADTSHWLIDPVRRGQLLPFYYPRVVIGIGRHNIGASPFSGAKSMGQNFAVGDKLTTSGGHGTGVEIKVTAIGSGGVITGWEFTKDELGNDNWGEGFLPEDFATQGTDPTSDLGQEGSIKLIKKTGSGTGLDYTYNRNGKWVSILIYGLVHRKKGLDAGPTRGTVIKQLSLPSNPPDGNGDRGNGRCSGQAKNGISLDAAHDGAYDLFLLFHSDVQHYLRSDIVFSGNMAQYCTMEISTAG